MFLEELFNVFAFCNYFCYGCSWFCYHFWGFSCQAASSSHVANAVFATAAPTVTQQLAKLLIFNPIYEGFKPQKTRFTKYRGRYSTAWVQFYLVMQRRASPQSEWADKSSGWQKESSTSSNAAWLQNRFWLSAVNVFVVKLLTAQVLEGYWWMNQRGLSLYTAAPDKKRNHWCHEECCYHGNNHGAEMTGQRLTHSEVSAVWPSCPYMFRFRALS